MANDTVKRNRPLSKDEYRRQWDEKPRPSVRQDAAEAMKIPELLRALEYIRDSTGDPLFTDTIKAIEAYGFKGRGLKRGGADASKQSWGDPDEGYLNHIRFDIERFGWSVPESAQHVVSQYNAPGQSFDTAVERLAARYRTWAAAGHPAPSVVDPGDTGQTWTVFPADGVALNLGHLVVPPEGVNVRVTNFWRRIFRDGVIRVQAVTPE